MTTRDDQKMNGLQRALRVDLYETGLQVQVMNNSNHRQAKEIFDRINALIGLAKLTHVEEEKIFFPSLAITAPFIVTLLEQEKEKINLQVDRLSLLMDEWEESFSPNEKAGLSLQVQFAFNDWMAYLLQYMNKQQMLIHQASEVKLKEKAVVVAA